MKRFFSILLFTLLMSVTAFSQITISQEDYAKLPQETKSQIEQVTVKSNIKEVSEYANLGKEIGIAVNETLKAVEESAVRISKTDLGQTAITIVVWKLLYKEISGLIIGFILLVLCIYMILTGVRKLSKSEDDSGGWMSLFCGAIFFIASMICIFA